MNVEERNRREWEDPANWRGPFYFGERDTRILVPKRGRHRHGHTLNLATTAGRLIFAALIALGLAGMALAIAFGGKS